MYRIFRSYKGLKPLVGILFILGSLALAQDFDWKAYKGETLNVLLQEHPFQEALVAELPKFTELTGINVTTTIAENYYDDMTLDLARGKSSQYDLFMTDVYHIWQFAPAGWLEKLEPYLSDTSKTYPDYDFEDVFQGLRDSTKWNLESGRQYLGQGSQYALPFGFETSALVYRKDIFEKHGLSVPNTLEEFYGVIKKLNEFEENASIAMYGSTSWEMIDSGFMNLYSGHGCIDFDETMTPQMNSSCAAEITTAWLDLITMYETKNQMLEDFNQGNITMMITDTFFDLENATSAPILGGQQTHVDIDSLVMNARSKHKDAAWLFMQWATGKEFLSSAAINYNLLNPVRVSIWENPDFQEAIKLYTNYYETFSTLMPNMKVQFSPQPLFFETTAQWARVLQDIYAGADIQQRLDELVSSITEQLQYARLE